MSRSGCQPGAAGGGIRGGSPGALVLATGVSSLPVCAPAGQGELSRSEGVGSVGAGKAAAVRHGGESMSALGKTSPPEGRSP